MKNLKYTLRFFALGLLLTFVAVACKKEDDANPKNPDLSNGSYVELEFQGKKYKVDGLGSTLPVDTSFVVENQTLVVNHLTGLVAEHTWIENQIGTPVQIPMRSLIFTIVNYKGKGKYGLPDFSDSEPSGVLSFQYSEDFFNINGEGFIIHTSGNHQMEIKTDNDKEMSGTFSFDGRVNGTSEAFPCTGKFKIVKN